MAYLGRQPNTGVRSRYIYTATASQTTFSGSDDDGKTLKYEDAAYLDVFLNGVLLKPVTDYTATSKTSVVLTSGAAVSDIVEIVAYDIANIADTVSKANGGTFDAGVTVNGTVTSDGLTVDGNLSVDGGTIKLDGNHPVGSNNVALGNTALDSNVSGASNTAIGADALTANTASNNTAVGYQAGYSNTTGTGNAFFGRISGYSNTADYNNAFGAASLYSNTSGTLNVAVGDASLYANTTGSYNTSIGGNALRNNTTPSNQTAVGYQAGYSNTTGPNLTAVGRWALYANTTGADNTAVGLNALLSNTTGGSNIAVGQQALNSNTTASNNTAIGYQAGYTNSTSGQNSYLGRLAGYYSTGGENTFVGDAAGSSMTSGSKNTILGRYNGNQGGLDIRTSSGNIVLSDGDGNPRGYFTGSNGKWNLISNAYNELALNLRNTYASSAIYGLGIHFENAAPNDSSRYFINTSDSSTSRFRVYSNGNVVNSNNSYGSISDEKLKENIVDSGSQWDDIKALRVRKYSMKEDALDTPNRLGVIAQEVEAAGMGGLVFESPDRDIDNNDLGTVTKQVNYSILYMKAVKALQEAMERIETLEAKVQALENA